MSSVTGVPGATPKYTKKDFESDQDVRWCPGCGDYAILSAVQKMMPDLGIPREDIVFISGIGCSSRFPYYMNTYGFHTIHGRAPAVATGLKLARPELKIFVVTGDGDGLSIGGNHLLHVLRRNVDLTILLFNNRIYGLTKGQYSPTSELGKVTKSTPIGSADRPLSPCAFALAAGATFVARTVDRNIAHMEETLKRASAHKGAAFVEILQNCNVYNDMAWGVLYDRESKVMHELRLAARQAAGLRAGRRPPRARARRRQAEGGQGQGRPGELAVGARRDRRRHRAGAGAALRPPTTRSRSGCSPAGRATPPTRRS